MDVSMPAVGPEKRIPVARDRSLPFSTAAWRASLACAGLLRPASEPPARRQQRFTNIARPIDVLSLPSVSFHRMLMYPNRRIRPTAPLEGRRRMLPNTLGAHEKKPCGQD